MWTHNSKSVLASLAANIPSIPNDIQFIDEHPPKIIQLLHFSRWIFWAIAFAFLITAINHEKKYKALSTEEQQIYKKKHVKSSIFLIIAMSIFIIIGLLVGWVECF